MSFCGSQTSSRPPPNPKVFKPAEAALFLKAGVDGYFTDHPAVGVAARDAFGR
jgi:glycerophosphoryl diester phosphodiesterase